MSRTRVFSRLGMIVGALFAMLWVASPALADDTVSTEISRLSSTLTAGGKADEFRTTLQNNTDEEIAPVRRVVAVRLAGIKADGVRIFLGPVPLGVQAVSDGEVRAVDPLPIRLGPQHKSGDQSRQEYSIQFTSTAPSGRGEVVFQAYHDTTLLGSSAKTVTVVGGTAGRHTETPTVGSSAEVAPGGVTIAVSPLSGDKTASRSSDGSSVPAVFYVLGAILVAVGAAILWLLFRPRPALVAGHTGDDVGHPRSSYPHPVPTLAYPRTASPEPQHAHAANTLPTQVMPVHPTDTPPPAVDPWAVHDRDDDDTRFAPPAR